MRRANDLGYRIPLFDRTTFRERRAAVARAMQQEQLDLLLVTVPEHIYYLIGLDHFGYFAFHMVALDARGEAVLIARRMEGVTVGRDVPDLSFAGYGDDDDLAAHCLSVVAELVDRPGRVGFEARSLYLPPAVAVAIVEGLVYSEMVDASDLVERLRFVQSVEELEVTRQAARISDAMVTAALAVAGAGTTEREVASATVEAMMAAGGEPPAFWPFVRSTNRLNEDHTTWTDHPLIPGDALFIELSGSIGRYHAPMGRVAFIERAPPGAEEVAAICLEAFEAARSAASAGAVAGQVYASWQAVVDGAGLTHYRRHHCGYATGIGFPPSWSGGGVPRALRPDSPTVLADGMVFHLMSWMMGTGRGDYFVSDPVVIRPGGAERLTTTPQALRVL